MLGRLLGCYIIYTFSGAVAPDRILSGAKYILRPSLAFLYVGSVTARHSSSGRQPNFAAWCKEWNYGTFAEGATIYSAERPLRWASAYILAYICLARLRNHSLVVHTPYPCTKIMLFYYGRPMEYGRPLYFSLWFLLLSFCLSFFLA